MKSYVLPPTSLKVSRLDDAVAAERALAESIAKNTDKKRPAAGISPEQAETLLQWVVYRTRKCLVEGALEHSLASPVSLFTRPQEMMGKCIASAAIASVQCELLGTEVLAHHTGDLDGSMVNAHLFLVVKMPVADSSGKVEMKPYLVDTTFQQFFDPESKSNWAMKLLRKEGGKALADDLLKHGFVALDKKNAALYLDSHAEASMGLDRKDPLEVLMTESSQIPLSREFEKWDEAVKDTMDIRTPSMVEAGVSTLHAAQSYDALPASRLSSVIGEGKVRSGAAVQTRT